MYDLLSLFWPLPQGDAQSSGTSCNPHVYLAMHSLDIRLAT